MSEKNKAIVRHYMDALNAKDLAALDEIFAPEYANHSPRIGVTGKDATLEDYEQTFKAFPDRVGTIEELIAEGDKVFLRQFTRTTFQQAMPDKRQWVFLDVLGVDWRKSMSTGKVQRPKEGDGRDPIVGPCPYCGKFEPNDVIQRFQAGRYPEPFAWCPGRGCKGRLRINRSSQTFDLVWE